MSPKPSMPNPLPSAEPRPSRLFGLPEYSEATQAVITEAIDAVARALDPIYGQIHVERSAIPLRTRLSLPDGKTIEHGPDTATSTLTVSGPDAMSGDFSSVYASIHSAAEDFLKSFIPALFGYISEVTDATGNVVSGDGKGPTWDLYLDAVERMDLEFDEDGKPHIQMVMHPDTAEKFEALGPPSLEQVARFEAMMQRKKAEVDARRRRRTLS